MKAQVSGSITEGLGLLSHFGAIRNQKTSQLLQKVRFMDNFFIQTNPFFHNLAYEKGKFNGKYIGYGIGVTAAFLYNR
jgi:hypothetical protein